MSDNSRLAKNTLYLYLRLAIIMIVKLYTSRVLLEVLGIDDYGVWNAVAAFVISFSFISNPLVTATQRFLNYDMARGGQNLSNIFMTSLEFFILISVVVCIGLETAGLWFLKNKMNFPPDVRGTVGILFQFSVVTLLINLLRMPFESSIIAEEKMSFYAGVCVLEAVSLLFIAFVIKYDFGYSRLVVYGFLNFISALFVMGCYVIFCYRKFSYTVFRRFQFHHDSIKEMAAFSGWNLFGACASMSATQGINTLINMFFGVAVNAAYGIAIQVQGAVSNVVLNLQKAANPQIVKSFSASDMLRTRFLVINVCKYSYLLTLLFALPLIFNIDYILQLWLGDNVPPMTNVFSSLILLLILLVSFSGPMDTAILASGNIKKFQLTYSVIIFSNIILVYLFFKIGFQSYWALIIKCVVELFIIAARLIFLYRDIRLKFLDFFRNTLFPCIVISVFGICSLWIFSNLMSNLYGFGRLVFSSLSFAVVFCLSTWFFAIPSTQRVKLLTTIQSKISGH